MLANLSTKAYGIDSEGKPTTGNPVIEGTINIAGSIYEDTEEAVKSKYPNIVLNVLGGYYLRFADPEVLSVLLANGVGDGVGITKEAAAEVTSIGKWFKDNTTITSFDELRFFAVEQISAQAFYGCSNLNNIDLTRIKAIVGYGAFIGCTELEDVRFGELEQIGEAVFKNCAKAKITVPTTLKRMEYSSNFEGCKAMCGDINIPNYSGSIPATSFANTAIERVLNLGGATSFAGAVFRGNTHLTVAILPPTMTSASYSLFYGCSVLETVICKSITPPALNENNNFNNTPIQSGTGSIYVPDASVSTYREATNWSIYASRIFPISQLPSDNPDLYEEIKEYL
jgi:hypothetical protein